ncbi:SpoVR family protein [Pseudenhygromyxa sp. WMMC2535]|uniref:SpoVR family protein n=1 Tax=Pseudenhygromyxa sp. WMMC2535 TaxID=2712867 RepID=UPI001556A0B5|nr:SpoVR family protein [Pseudenhygromyxa sp. WMMC2535]NVB43343.1 SpoVR family protein [Pseudenhygromyxa sp. WMMC2535]
MAPIPAQLSELQHEIEGYAKAYGLDCFTTIYELVDYRQMCEIAAYEGFPVRYPHWRFGMEYDRMMKSQTYGLSKIYELVINTDPCYAYLLEGNSLVDQKLVMSHVTGHCDFFKNNRFFAHTDRRMIDGMANHASRVRRHMDRQGVDPVESFIDVCNSLDNLIDPWVPFRATTPSSPTREPSVEVPINIGKLSTDRAYLDQYINPPEFIEEQRKRALEQREQAKKLPPRPERDVLGFLMMHAPLEPWEADVLGIIREEAYYFLPQRQTKIMNEGWATYWHSKIMTSKALRDDEVIDYAEAASGVTAMAPNQLNPYKIGVELYRDIEERWNKGKFGKQWDECDDQKAREEWDMKLQLGQSKIFEVRRHYNDVTFIDEFFTMEFCRRHRFFTFAENRRSGQLEIASREFKKIKDQMLQQLTNFGQPFIYVVDANYLNRGELLLAHRHEGVDLRIGYARETLKNLERIWRRPVAILTVIEDKPKRIRFDGTGIEISEETAAWRLA